MLGGLFLAAKAQNLFITVVPNFQDYITGGYVRFEGAGFPFAHADINISRSTFNLTINGNPPLLLPYFAIHEIYGVASGGGGGGSRTSGGLTQRGEGGRAGQPYSVYAKPFSPVMKTQFCIINRGGSSGVNGQSGSLGTSGENGVTEIMSGFLFSVKTPVVTGAGGRRADGVTNFDYTGQVSSSPPSGNGGDGGTAGSTPKMGNAGSLLCRGLIW